MGTRTGMRVAIAAAPLAVAAVAVGSHGCGTARHLEQSGAAAGGSELNIQVVSLDLSTPAAPKVTFKMTDRSGAAVDVLAELANAPAKTVPYISNGPRFTLAQVEADGSTTSWYESTVNPVAFTPPAGGTTFNQPATQPGFQQAPAANPGSRITVNGDGTFTFAFTAPTTDASKRDATKTLTAGIWAERIQNRPNGGPKRWPAAATSNFVQGGGTPAAPHQAVTDAACNTCHVTLRAHDRRQTVQLCKTCHSGSPTNLYRDPESGTNLDFRSMIHRIHLGADLPSVKAGGAFYVVGFQGAVTDFSDSQFPALRSATECTTCHQGGTDADNWKTHANVTACTSCHDEIRFDGSAGATCQLGVEDVQPCNHVAGVSATANCAGCHAAGAAAIGPDVVHHNDLRDLAAQWQFEILSVTTGDDRKPVVQFRVLFEGGTNDIKNDAAWKQGAASRLFVDVGWPTVEFTNDGAGYVDTTVKPTYYPNGTPGQGQPVQINALTAATTVAGQTNVFQVTSPTAVPLQFASFRVVLEGHPASGTGATAVRIPVSTAIQDAAIGGGSPQARRSVVSADTCNACHGAITAHGSNRNADPAICVVCHTPRTTDYVRRVQANVNAGNPGAQPTAEAPIDFKVLVHEIHASDIRKTPATVFAFGGTPTDFPAAFPGQTGRCTICHVNDSYKLPFKAEVLDTTTRVGDPTSQDPAADPAEQRMGRTVAVCTSCHDMVRFDAATTSRPVCNSLVPVNSAECSHSGGVQSDESGCATCHGTAGAFDVATVHPINDQPQ